MPVHLLGYLAQLPLCRDTGELLQTTLAQALRLTAAEAGLALAAGAPIEDAITEGLLDPAILTAVQRLLPALAPDGELTLTTAPEPLIWTENLVTAKGAPRPYSTPSCLPRVICKECWR